MFNLLITRRFLPYFQTQFLGAFNDNVYKNSLVILIAYSALYNTKINVDFIVNLCAGLFILPYFLFSAFAGQIADKVEKSSYIRTIKLVEIGIMCLGAFAFITDNLIILLLTLFFMGTQSSFFGPVKYGILPQHLEKNELVAANALVEMGTFLAILLGTVAGGILISLTNGTQLVAVTIIGLAILGWLCSRKIPLAPAVDPLLKLNYNIFSESSQIIRQIYQNKNLFLAIIGISWFWFYGAIILAQFPAYTKLYLHGDEKVVTLLLAIFSTGIGIGSIFCARLAKHDIKRSLRLIPWGAMGLSVFGLGMAWLKPTVVSSDLVGAWEFISHQNNLILMANLVALSLCGGIFIVPLYTYIQHYAPSSYRSRVIAGNNILNAFFMVIASLFAIVFLLKGGTILHLFEIIALLNLIVIIYSCKYIFNQAD